MYYRILPLPDQQIAFLIDGREWTRWHFGANMPRPFLYPMPGPSGHSVTRMGHPGAPNHDHHQSVWFAHNKVLGLDFWGNGHGTTIRQTQWLAMRDGDDEGLLAVELGWYDGHDPQELITQQVIFALRRHLTETLMEIQTTLKPAAATLELQQTNFGLLAVRVASHLSGHFGGGKLTDSEGHVGEKAIFGNHARWMDYSGPLPRDLRNDGDATTHEGITFFDHPSNPNHPTGWHVREDGWMGASLCMEAPIVLKRDSPLTLRYLLAVHEGECEADWANDHWAEFAASAGLVCEPSKRPHQAFRVARMPSSA